MVNKLYSHVVGGHTARKTNETCNQYTDDSYEYKVRHEGLMLGMSMCNQNNACEERKHFLGNAMFYSLILCGGGLPCKLMDLCY